MLKVLYSDECMNILIVHEERKVGKEFGVSLFRGLGKVRDSRFEIYDFT